MGKKTKISFDFDSTLSRPDIQDFVKELTRKDVEIWICTSRFEDGIDETGKNWNKDLFLVAKNLDIPIERIIFTNWKDKKDYLENIDFLIHLDDDYVELDKINKYTKTKGISVTNTTQWKKKVLKILNNKKINYENFNWI